MIAISKNRNSDDSAESNDQFLEMVPGIKHYAHSAFRHLSPEDREEAVCEVVAIAFQAFRRLIEREREDLAFATPLARFAIAKVRMGRHSSGGSSPRDVLSAQSQRRHGFRVTSLDSTGSGSWAEALADDLSTPVPDQAAFRLDFPAWLGRLDRRKRDLVEFLAVGNSAVEAAQRFQLTQARVSQLRAGLRVSWHAFHGEAILPTAQISPPACAADMTHGRIASLPAT